jgi:seryl-tRNA synthetase
LVAERIFPTVKILEFTVHFTSPQSNRQRKMNKTIQDLKLEVETIKKSQRETTIEVENLGEKSGAIDASITNRIQEIEERISGAEDTMKNIDTTIKEIVKCRVPNPKHPENPGHNERTKPTDNKYR